MLKRILSQVGGVIAIAMILGGFIIAYNTTYTTVLSLDMQAEEGWAKIVDDMTERYGGIPDLAATLGPHPGPDATVIDEATRNLDMWRGALSQGEMGKINEATTDLEASLMDLTEALARHPGIRGSGEVQDLLGAVGRAGEALSADQVTYNEVVWEYNMALGSFPGSLWAENWGFVRRDYFMAKIGNREPPLAPVE